MCSAVCWSAYEMEVGEWVGKDLCVLNMELTTQIWLSSTLLH